MSEELKEGSVIYRRRWNIYGTGYRWDFYTVKKVTPTGKIRLESGTLLNSLGDFKIYDEKAKKLYIEDNIKESVSSMISNIGRYSDTLSKVSSEDMIRLGNLLEELKIEDVAKWGNDSSEKSYRYNVNKFKKCKSMLESFVDTGSE